MSLDAATARDLVRPATGQAGPAVAARGQSVNLRRDVNLLLNMLLPTLLVLSFATGWIASWLGLTEFGVHKYTSIAVFVAASGHLVLHWRSLVVQVRRVGGGVRAAAPLPKPQPASQAVDATPVALEHDMQRPAA